jgi:hypothetical protein
MILVKETEKAKLLEKDGVSFWVQERWVRTDGTLTPAGIKSYAIARKNHVKHEDFNARKTFAVVRETDKAVLLRCKVFIEHELRETFTEFWIPKSMAENYQFVRRKVAEVERSFPFIGTKVIWPGRPGPI